MASLNNSLGLGSVDDNGFEDIADDQNKSLPSIGEEDLEESPLKQHTVIENLDKKKKSKKSRKFKSEF